MFVRVERVAQRVEQRHALLLQDSDEAGEDPLSDFAQRIEPRGAGHTARLGSGFPMKPMETAAASADSKRRADRLS